MPLSPVARVGVLTTLLVAFVGCGGGSGGGEAAQTVLAGAADATTGARSARIVFEEREVEIDDPEAVASSNVGEGIYDFVDKTGRFTYSMSFGGEEGGGDSEMLIVGDTGYIKSPLLSGLLQLGGTEEPDDRPWLEFSTTPDDLSPEADLLLGSPDSALGTLKEIAGPIERVGTQSLRGTETTRYKATYDWSKPRNGTTTLGGDVERAPADFEVWVDDQGRVRKMTIVQPFPDGRNGEGTATTETFSYELFDFGVPVSVKRPPSDQVRPLPTDDETTSTTVD